MMVTGWALFGTLAILGVWLFGIAHDWNVVASTRLLSSLNLGSVSMLRNSGQSQLRKSRTP